MTVEVEATHSRVADPVERPLKPGKACVVVDARYANFYPNALAEFTLELTRPLLSRLCERFGADAVRVLFCGDLEAQSPKVRQLWADLVALGVCLVASPRPLSPGAMVFEAAYVLRHSVRLWVSYHFHLPFFYRGRSVAIVHDMMPIALEGYLLGRARRIKAALFRIYVKRAVSSPKTVVFSPSTFTHQEIQRITGRRPCRWHRLEPGVSSEFPPEPPRWTPPEDRITVFFIGERRPNKNVDRLIRVCRLINEVVPCELVIAGKPDDFHFSLLHELSLNIRFVGRVSDESKFALMATASYVALISSYEGYGIPVSEANALGVPVLSTKNTVMAEQCGPGDCLLNLDDSDGELADAVVRHWRGLLQTAGVKVPRLRSWRTVSAEWMALLEAENCFL